VEGQSIARNARQPIAGPTVNPSGAPEELRGPLLSYFPAMVLVAQLLVSAGMATVTLVLVTLVRNVGFGWALPKNPLGVLLGFAVGVLALWRSACSCSSPACSSAGWRCRWRPCRRPLRDAWSGSYPDWSHLGAMALAAVVFSFAATRLFRWQ
jgi:ABC-2 type transport system permease protein